MEQKWHSIRNKDDRSPLGRVVILSIIYDNANFKDVQGVWTNEGFKIIEQIPDVKHFMCITAWKYKE